MSRSRLHLYLCIVPVASAGSQIVAGPAMQQILATMGDLEQEGLSRRRLSL